MSVLGDLLDLPREVTKSSFVVRLTEGVTHPRELIDSYAVTPDIVRNLDLALGYVQAAVRDRHSEAAYVHGSFGSGKSHFMAVLSLLLANDPTVWGEPDLHALRAKHEWVKDKKILRLHFHMIGARTSEEAIFSGYLARVAELHPDASVAPLFEDEALFDNAQKLRQALGEEPFFAKLNETGGAKKGWGKLAEQGVWDAAAFDRTRASSDRDERARLFSALVRTLFPAFATSTGGFVGLDVGLGRMTRHAATLGYDAVALFLDELILWLASRAGDKDWVTTEITKLSKLVEAQDERREIPIVSFLARQRDIAEMVGEQYAGPEVLTLRDALRWWEGRFNTIKLEDRNLPTVVEKRVVRPKDAAARQTLDQAFARMRSGLGQQGWATLLGDLGDEKAFRQVYPFSPALIEALVALSSFLQRERTALKVLVELLVEHLSDFEMGRVVAVGDLYDVLAGGEEPMDGHMREHFAAAKRLYSNELLPRIQSQNETATKVRCQRLRDEHPIALGCSNCPETRCRADNRMVKTLLLAALVPGLTNFRNLTVSRLVQLNHGTLKAAIPGQEVSMAAARLRSWSAEIGKLRVDGEGDPRVTVVLEGVDVRPIIESARGAYSPGAGRTTLREILFEALGLDVSEATVEHKVPWRGTKRAGVVQFGNVREMDDTALTVPPGAEYKLIIDYPFDDPGRGPEEDERHVAAFVARGQSHTIVWLPNFFGDRVKKDLMELVVIDRILEDALRTYLAHLRPDDQRRAREELEHLRSQKRARVRRAMEAAYGLKRAEEGDLDPAHKIDRHIHVLKAGLEIRGVTETVLDRAVDKAGQELFDLLYPRHPYFSGSPGITPAKLKAAYERLERLCEVDGQRLPITRQEAGDWEILQQLDIVQVTEAWARLRPEWSQDIDQMLRQDGIDKAPTVEQLRRLRSAGGQRGLTLDVADFEVMAYAVISRRELLLGKGAAPAWTFGKLSPDAELVQTPLPDEKPWQDALDRAGQLFGVALGGRARNARNLRLFFERTSEKRAAATRDGADRIAELVGARAAFLPPSAPRLVTAQRAAVLLATLDTRNAVELTEALGRFDAAPSSLTAIARHIDHAAKVAHVLAEDVYFNVFEALQGAPRPEARELLQRVQQSLGADELVVDLAAELPVLSAEGQRLLRGTPVMQGPGAGADSGTPGSGAGVGAGDVIVRQAEGEGLEAISAAREDAARALAAAGPGARVVFSWKVIKRA